MSIVHDYILPLYCVRPKEVVSCIMGVSHFVFEIVLEISKAIPEPEPHRLTTP